ncbi:hypothetical protein [Polaribacter sp. KT 15]|uniref:hypothetical protein n=1 Tax=Polaribacter sp. KT 15 TaxID=1896175 RepID=UPI00090A9A71|nr:hypothetical protein [Polaribacter sp. KT 15]SHM78934.1 hypothetical protein SAMN05720268_0551 [Polaribacter sp. KT 15]
MKNKYSIDSFDVFLKNYFIILEIYSKEELLSLYEEWSKNNGVFFHDYLWLLFNKAILKNGDLFQESKGESFYQNAFYLYNSMAHFRREEGASKAEINKFHRLSHEVYVEEVKNDKIGVTNEIVLIPHPKCKYANSLNKKIYSIDCFLEECKIASEDCTLNFGCGCSISKIPKRDKKGNLIFLNELSTETVNDSKGCVFTFLSIIISFGVSIYLIVY